MFAEQTATRTRWINVNWIGPDFFDYPVSEFPHITEAGGPIFADIFSQANSRGRLCLWIRGDAVQPAPTYSTGGTGADFIYYSLITVRDQYDNYLGYVEFGIDSANRRPYVQMGNYIQGTSVVTYAASGVLPTDGAWHFFGFYWDYAAGNARVVHNSTESSSSFWAGTYNGTSQLPATDFQGRGLLNYYTVSINSHLPISEVMFDFGKPYAAGFWDDQYPVPAAPGGSMTIRPIKNRLAGLASSEAVNSWELLAELARNTSSMYRVNESDNLEFLPPSYFGETAQMTIAAVEDTRTNAAEILPSIDTSQTRNVVTVQFQDSSVDFGVQPMMAYTSPVEIPKGTSYITFPLDVPCVEIHGASNPTTNSNYQILNLTSSQISTPTLPAGRHFITVNSNSEGGGTVLSEFQVAASFVSADAISVTIKFINGTGATAYLVNNGSSIPCVYVLGYGLRSGDGYTTVRDSDSVRLRGERGLDAEMDWIHDRATAADLAATLLTTVGQPRPQVSLRVLGDPRRKPGQLITIADSAETAAAGNWRIVSVRHNVQDAGYTQDIQAVQVLPIAVWDGSDGWDNAVWS
jgi:hypothetical protein